LIETWIELKREDIDAVRLRPQPDEFELYYEFCGWWFKPVRVDLVAPGPRLGTHCGRL
jgi:hypothetical protein